MALALLCPGIYDPGDGPTLWGVPPSYLLNALALIDSLSFGSWFFCRWSHSSIFHSKSISVEQVLIESLAQKPNQHSLLLNKLNMNALDLTSLPALFSAFSSQPTSQPVILHTLHCPKGSGTFRTGLSLLLFSAAWEMTLSCF